MGLPHEPPDCLAITCSVPRHQFAYDRLQFTGSWAALVVTYLDRSWALPALYIALLLVRAAFAWKGVKALVGWGDYYWHTRRSPCYASAFDYRIAWLVSALLAPLILGAVAIPQLVAAPAHPWQLAAIPLAWAELALCLYCWRRSAQQREQLLALAALLNAAQPETDR